MVLREQNADFIYRFHMPMTITSPNLNFIPCVEVEIPGGITPLSTNYAYRKMFTYVYPVICHSIVNHAHTSE